MLHVSRAGQTFGPYSIETARAYFHTGNIQDDDLVWSEDQNAWMPAQDHPLLKDSQPPPPPLKSPPPVQTEKSELVEALSAYSGPPSALVETLKACSDQSSHPIPIDIPIDKSPDSPKKVGGWLLLLCILLTIVNPIGTILYLEYIWSQGTGASPALYSLFLLASGIWFCITGLNLWKREPSAVQEAKVFLQFMAAYPLLAIVMMKFDGGIPDHMRDYLTNGMAYQILPQILWSTLWYQYLSHSERVRETFPPLNPTA